VHLQVPPLAPSPTGHPRIPCPTEAGLVLVRNFLLPVLVCLVALSGNGGSAFSAPRPHSIIAGATGKVEVLHAGATRPASFGFTLERGDRVVVAPGASATVYLSDGNVL